MALLVGYTTNIENAFAPAEEGGTYTELIAFYLAERVFYVLYFLLLSYFIPMIRYLLIFLCFLMLIPFAIWVSSIHVSYPNQLAPIWIAICMSSLKAHDVLNKANNLSHRVVFDLFGQGLIYPIFQASEMQEETWFTPITRRMQFMPAVNIEHRTERTNSFVTLVIGYSIVSLIYQSAAPRGTNAFYGKAVLGLVIAFSFHMLYFEVDSANLHKHAIRRKPTSCKSST